MKRREFLSTSLLSAAGLCLGGLPGSAAPQVAGRRHNILLIMCDQLFAGAMGCAGDPYVKTPNMDALAAAGVRFELAYTTQPLCTPLRTSLMTGRMPHETGVVINSTERPSWAADPAHPMPMLGAVLSEAGYECAMIGKWHIPVGARMRDVHGFSTFHNIASNDSRVARESAAFLRQKHEKPFLLFASLLNPHDICQYSRGFTLPCGPIPPNPAPGDCPPLPANFAIPPHEPDALRSTQRLNNESWPTVDWTPDRWRQYRWAYERLIEKVDGEIGVILRALRESGQERNTVVVFTADHGDGAAAHRWNQKQVLYEEPARVPLIVRQTGIVPGGRVDRENLISTGLDLFPTICDYAGVKPPAGLRGRTLRPLAEGRAAGPEREFVVAETTFTTPHAELLGLEGRLLRTRDYKYIVYSKGRLNEQLFDMRRDPGEMINLAVSAEYRKVLERHRQLLAEWMKEAGDIFPSVASPAVPVRRGKRKQQAVGGTSHS